MTTVAHSYPFIIGVDTHARTHTYAVLAANGEHLATETFPNTHSGRSRAIAWAARHTGGDLGTLWIIEGAGSYGALLAGTVARAGYRVAEAPRVTAYAPARRGTGKSDPLDAAAIAAAALPLEEAHLRTPRQDEGVRAALRVLVAAREQMTVERTAKVNALIALLRSLDLGIDARKPLSDTKITEVSHWRARDEALAAATARAEAVRLAKRISVLDSELKDNQTRTTELIEASPAAPLLKETGIGPVTAAVVYTAWSHLGRVRSEAAFAALAGRESHPRILREHRAPPAQPGRRQAPELRTAHGHRRPHRPRPGYPCLRRTPQSGRQDPTRNPAMPQALPRPPPLPHPQRPRQCGPDRRLTDIEDSDFLPSTTATRLRRERTPESVRKPW